MTNLNSEIRSYFLMNGSEANKETILDLLSQKDVSFNDVFLLRSYVSYCALDEDILSFFSKKGANFDEDFWIFSPFVGFCKYSSYVNESNFQLLISYSTLNSIHFNHYHSCLIAYLQFNSSYSETFAKFLLSNSNPAPDSSPYEESTSSISFSKVQISEIIEKQLVQYFEALSNISSFKLNDQDFSLISWQQFLVKYKPIINHFSQIISSLFVSMITENELGRELFFFKAILRKLPNNCATTLLLLHTLVYELQVFDEEVLKKLTNDFVISEKLWLICESSTSPELVVQSVHFFTSNYFSADTNSYFSGSDLFNFWTLPEIIINNTSVNDELSLNILNLLINEKGTIIDRELRSKDVSNLVEVTSAQRLLELAHKQEKKLCYEFIIKTFGVSLSKSSLSLTSLFCC